MKRDYHNKLYRRVNTKTFNVHHMFGSDYSLQRAKVSVDFETQHSTMHGRKQRGLDYTPLFNFLLSNVGKDWDSIYKEAKLRLDKEDPIFWIVARSEVEKRDIVRVGESTYYSGLYIDDNKVLQKVNASIKNEDLQPLCPCCTYTFNGKRFQNKFDMNKQGNIFRKNFV